MNSDKSKPAYPRAAWEMKDKDEGWIGAAAQDGMTLREHYAGLAMQGILAAIRNSPNSKFTVNDGFIHYESVAIEAVSLADALIEQLNRPV